MCGILIFNTLQEMQSFSWINRQLYTNSRTTRVAHNLTKILTQSRWHRFFLGEKHKDKTVCKKEIKKVSEIYSTNSSKGHSSTFGSIGHRDALTDLCDAKLDIFFNYAKTGEPISKEKNNGFATIRSKSHRKRNSRTSGKEGKGELWYPLWGNGEGVRDCVSQYATAR